MELSEDQMYKPSDDAQGVVTLFMTVELREPPRPGRLFVLIEQPISDSNAHRLTFPRVPVTDFLTSADSPSDVFQGLQRALGCKTLNEDLLDLSEKLWNSEETKEHVKIINGDGKKPGTLLLWERKTNHLEMESLKQAVGQKGSSDKGLSFRLCDDSILGNMTGEDAKVYAIWSYYEHLGREGKVPV